MTSAVIIDLDENVTPAKGEKTASLETQAEFIRSKLPFHCEVKVGGGEIFVFLESKDAEEEVTKLLDDQSVSAYVYEAEPDVLAATF